MVGFAACGTLESRSRNFQAVVSLVARRSSARLLPAENKAWRRGGIGQVQRGWYYGWNIGGVLIICQMAANGLTFNSLSLFLPGWSEDLHAPVSELALPFIILSAALIGFNTGVFAPVAATISAEFGARGFGKAFGLLMFFLPPSAPLAFTLAKTRETTGSYIRLR
jgi:hypothetical protein